MKETGIIFKPETEILIYGNLIIVSSDCGTLSTPS